MAKLVEPWKEMLKAAVGCYDEDNEADEYHARVLVPEGLTASGRPGDDASNR